MSTRSTAQKRVPRSSKKVSSSVLSNAQRNEVSRIANRIATGFGETKYVTTAPTSATTALSTTWQFVSLTDVGQGTTDSTRVGDKLTPKSLQMMLEVQTNTASAVAVHYVRFVVLQYMGKHSVDPPTGSNCFLNDPITSTVTYRSYPIVDGKVMMHLLYDHTFALPQVLTSGVPTAHFLKTMVNLSSAKKTIEYLAGSATDAYGKIYFGFIASSGTTPPNFSTQFKFDYSDQ